MQPEAAEERDDDIAEGRSGHDEGEVGPGERGHIAGEEAYEEDDSGDDVGVCRGRGGGGGRWWRSTGPTWAMPRERRVSPTEAVSMTAMRTAYWEGFRRCFMQEIGAMI